MLSYLRSFPQRSGLGSPQQVTHLDLLITKSNEDDVSSVYLSIPNTSDHSALHFKLACAKPAFERNILTYRNFKAIDTESFREDLLQSSLFSSREKTVSNLVNQYQDVLSQLLDKHAPEKTCLSLLKSSICHFPKPKGGHHYPTNQEAFAGPWDS